MRPPSPRSGASGLQAIIFDFDGVIANSEPLHLRAFQEALGERGVFLSREEYFSRYLGYDDVGAFQALSRERRLGWSDGEIAALVALKGVTLQAMMHAGEVLFPGAADFVRAAAAAVPVAIASGALRHEIDEIVEAAGIASCFVTIVASGDTPESKPSPAPYRLAFDRLNERAGGTLEPWRCV
ncbi:MAG: HAD family hydrolase, partial [Vicinamibacterales bacterium]